MERNKVGMDLAYKMVLHYGFNDKIGNISYYDSKGQREMSLQKPDSEETARLIDEEVRMLVREAYQCAKNLLTENKSALEQLAGLLLEKEVVYKEDLESILGKRMDK